MIAFGFSRYGCNASVTKQIDSEWEKDGHQFVKIHYDSSMPINAVGIDVSKGKNTVAVMQPLGVVVAEPVIVAHTVRELGELARFLKSLSGETKVIMESTGLYDDPIADFFHKSGIFVTVINPILIDDYDSNITVRKAKTDKKDAVKIAN